MIETASGIVLRIRPLTETSLIVNWLTSAVGRISTVAKGARRTKSPFRGKLDLFYEGEFSFVRSRRSELHTLREVALRQTHSSLRVDLHALRRASYASALIEQATEKETPMPAVYDLMRDFLQALPATGIPANPLLAFELKLLNELGLQPDLDKSRLTPGSRQIVKALLVSDWTVITRLKLTEAQLVEIRQFLHGFLIFHLGRIPANRSAAL